MLGAVIVIALWAGLIAWLAPAASAHSAAQAGKPVVIYFFWGDGCPHCAAAKPFLEGLTQRYPEVELRAYEVWYVAENRDLFIQMAAAFGFEPTAVPTIFIGDRYWIGYAEPVRAEIEAFVAECRRSGCPDAGRRLTGDAAADDAVADDAVADDAVADDGAADSPTNAPAADVLDLPLIGPVDLATQSLAVSTALIAFVDGFNPCSLWVLSILLSLALHTGSRRKVFLIGLVFLTVTSLVYALFIAGLFTVFSVISFLGWIQVVVALAALFFALVNIKDYFWYKEGISFTIADEQKPGIYQRMRRILDASDSLWGLLGATVVMSAGVSLVEFSCTAGFPVLWTNLLAAQGVPALSFALLLLLYMIIYQMDELGIFLAAVFTFKASKVQEKHGRILKLIGGMLMLTLAAVMVIDPTLMNKLSASLIIFGIALAASLLVLVVHRQLLPRWGIFIGTELAPRRVRRARR